MLDKQHLHYFKDLVEGTAEISLRAYLAQHAQTLRQQVSAARFARIKFNTMDEIIKILEEEQIACCIDEAAVKREKYWASFHLDVLDEKGRLKDGFKEGVFDGIFKKFEEKGDAAASDLHQSIGFDTESEEAVAEALQDIAYFAETEFTLGDRAFGLFLLKALASIERPLSLGHDVVIRAKKIIAGHE